ncbi:unnamed protein product [Absidia cylindrospora]
MAVGTVGWGKMLSFFFMVTPPPQQQQPESSSSQQQPESSQQDQQQQQQKGKEPAAVTPNDTYSPCHVDSNSNIRTMTQESIGEFKRIYGNMVDSLKWKLNSTGRFVEDVLFEYALTLKKENCLQSFILDDVHDLFSCAEV